MPLEVQHRRIERLALLVMLCVAQAIQRVSSATLLHNALQPNKATKTKPTRTFRTKTKP